MPLSSIAAENFMQDSNVKSKILGSKESIIVLQPKGIQPFSKNTLMVKSEFW